MTQLRPYQRLALYHLRKGLETGVWRQYVDLPTGTGKSTIIAAFAALRISVGRILALVHRQDLALQLSQTLKQEGLEVGLVMEGKCELNAPVVVATVQSLNPEMTQELLVATPIPILTLFIDEAHHAFAGSSYERIILEVEKVASEHPVATIGMTATPYRIDDHSMLDVLPRCAFARTIPEMVREGYLAPLTWKPLKVEMDLTQVTTSRKSGELDYSETNLARHLLHETITSRIVEQADLLIEQRPTLVFAASVKHARQLCSAFQAYGISADVVSGSTSRNQRDHIFANWRCGGIQMICNCALLTEGFDFPGVSALIIARPTLSPLLYMQMLGRGMRVAEGKFDCLVMDLVGNQPDPRRQVVLPHVIGIKEETEDSQHIGVQGSKKSTDPLLRSILGGQGETELALLDPLGRSRYRWTEYSGGYFARINRDTIAVCDRDPNKSGLYRSRLCMRQKGYNKEQRWIGKRLLPLRQQVALVHEVTKELYHEQLAGKEAPWLEKPLSGNQLKVLERLDRDLPKRAKAAAWNQQKASAAITFYGWRWELLHPPAL
jgi:ATP-dependent helicase IRC3